MNRNFLFNIVVILICTINISYAQNDFQIKIEQFKNKFSTLNFSTEKQATLERLVIIQQEQIAKCNGIEHLQDSTSVLTLSGGWECRKKSNQIFRKQLAQQITLDQFGELFKEVLQPKIKREIAETFSALKAPLKLSDSQEVTLQKLVTEKVTQEIIYFEYHYYNPNLANANRAVLNAQSQVEYAKKIQSFGLQQPIFVNTDHRLQDLVKRAQQAQISLDKINKIILHFLEAIVEKKQINSDFEVWKEDYVIYMRNNAYNANTVEKDFRKKLSLLLTIHEFGELFNKPLAKRVIKAQETKWENFQEANAIEEQYIPNFRTITDHYAKQEIIIVEYYNYDSKKLGSKLLDLKAEEKRAYDKAFYGLGIKRKVLDDFDKRVPFFVQRAQKAGVTQEKIKELVKAIKVREDEVEAYHQGFREWKDKYLIYFNDNETNPEGARKRLRKKLSELLTLEQFEQLFSLNLQTRINTQTRKRFTEVRNTYKNLKPLQLSGLETMLKEQVKKEILIYEYYGYDHKLAMQKLSASQYKFEKKYKSILKSLTIK